MENNFKLQIINFENVFYAQSNEVSIMLGKTHKHLMRDIRGYIDAIKTRPDLDSKDFFIEADYFDSNNRKRPCYWLTRKGCDMVANKMTGTKGILFTAEYVSRFEEMERQLKVAALPKDSYMIDDPIQRAKKWIEEEQERQSLKLKAEEQETQIQALIPKAAFADAVAASEDCILIRELAKLLKQNGAKTGERRLYEKLRQAGYLVKNPVASDFNMPTQYSMELGLFRIKETTIHSSSGNVHVSKTPKVTTKGVQYFIKKYQDGKLVLD